VVAVSGCTTILSADRQGTKQRIVVADSSEPNRIPAGGGCGVVILFAGQAADRHAGELDDRRQPRVSVESHHLVFDAGLLL
jgi:hypothetical protein